jgi:hypothetical protein
MALPPLTTGPPPNSGTTTADKWGLGQFGKEHVNYGSLFADHTGVHTAAGVMQFFASSTNPAEVAQIQQWLLLGGFYPQNYSPVFGYVGPKDIAAFRDAVKVSAESGGSAPPLDQMLSDRARRGQYYGQGQGTQYESLTHTLRLTPKEDLALTVENAFTKAIGRKPTDAELSAFTSEFQGQQRAAQEPGFAQEDAARQAYMAAQSGQGGGDQLPLIEDAGNPPGAAPPVSAARRAFDRANPDIVRAAQREQDTATLPRGDVAKLMTAIRSAESGGDYTAHASGSSASGAYQITDGTWGRYKGFAHAADAPRNIQDERAAQLVRQKLASYGGDVRKVVQSWYYPAGVGKDNLVPPGNRLSMGQYADRVLGSITGQPVNSGNQLPVSSTITVNDMPDPSSRAVLYARQHDPAGAYAEDFGHQGAAFMDLLRSSGG